MGLTIFCLYHAYKNNSESKWYWFILFFPLLGSIFYLYTHFYSKENIRNLSEGVASAVNKNHLIKKLEKELEFSPSITNKANLADAYVNQERYSEAEELYLSCLEGFNKNDISINQKLMRCYALSSQLEKAVSIGEKIENNRDFQKSEFRIIYAQVLANHGMIEKAEEHFKDMNSNYSNYPHRIAYVMFLRQQSRNEEANSLLNRMENEWNNMNRDERKVFPSLKSKLNSLRQE